MNTIHLLPLLSSTKIKIKTKRRDEKNIVRKFNIRQIMGSEAKSLSYAQIKT